MSKNKGEQARHEQEIFHRVIEMIRREDLNNFYGFTAEEVKRFCGAFRSLKQNGDTTFPDFYSENSCVELFNISSSELIKHGGAAQKMQDGKLGDQIERDDAAAAEGTLPVCRAYREAHPSHSYERLSESLHSQCLKHLGSLKKCEKRFDTKVFVIEHSETDLECAFAPVDDVNVNGVRPGDLLPVYENGGQSGLYRLSRDKENLLWLREHLCDVDFLVFAGLERIEAVNHHRADVLAALLPWRFVTAWAPSVTFATSVCLSGSVKGPQEKE